MSAAGAIEAGSSFIRFFADLSSLQSSIKTLGSEVKSWSTGVAKESSRKVSTAFEDSSNAANDFGRSTAAASAVVSGSLQNVTASAAGASGAINAATGSVYAMAATATPAQRVSSALAGVAVSAATLFSRLASMPPILATISGYLGFTIAKWSNFTAIGRNSLVAAMGMRYLSGILKQLGIDTTRLDLLQANLTKIGNRAVWAGRGVWLLVAPFKAVYSAASLAIGAASRLAGLTGRAFSGIGRAGRMGAVTGGIGTLAGTSAIEGEEGGGTGKVVAAGALSGLLMGGVVGAGIGAAAVGLGLTIKTALSRGAAEGARESKDFLTQLGVAMIDAGNFIKGVWTQIYDKFKSVFASMATEGPSVFDRIKDAVFPIVDAVKNVWLPGMFSAIDSIASYFRSGTQQLGRTWTDWIVESVASVADFIANFDLYFQYAQQTVVMWASNAILQVGDFFNNAVALASWFGENWYDVLKTVGNFMVTVFENSTSNIVELFSKLWEWVKGGMVGGLDFNFKGITDGFQSEIKEWPKLIKTELETSTPEMDAIAKRIAERQKATEGRRGQQGNIEAAASAVQEEAKRARDTRFGAVSAQSQDAYSALSRAMNATGTNKEEVGLLKQAVTELKTVAKNTGKATDKGAMPGWKMQP